MILGMAFLAIVHAPAADRQAVRANTPGLLRLVLHHRNIRLGQ
jgi:hypothetical protein